MLRWKSQGLPADVLSIENAIGILNSRFTSFPLSCLLPLLCFCNPLTMVLALIVVAHSRCPLIIDPSAQATEWLIGFLKVLDVSMYLLSSQEGTHLSIFVANPFPELIPIMDAPSSSVA